MSLKGTNMPVNPSNETNTDEHPDRLALLTAVLLAIALGVFGATLLLFEWGPALLRSILGPNPKAYWYLSRGSAFVALGLLWVSMALGLLITNKVARNWPGSPAAFAIHEFVSLLGLGIGIFHGLILMGDRYMNYQWVQILMPFGSGNYRPVWVGLGQIGLYAWAVISASFYVRQKIGPKTWRIIHFAAFANFLLALMHGLGSGTDTSALWAQWVYWFFGGSILFLTVYRVAVSIISQAPPAPARPVSAPPNLQIGRQ